MNFNPDPNKQAHEVILSRKAKEINRLPLVFNNTSVSHSSSQKHLGVILDSKSIFDEHLKMVSLKISLVFSENYITCYQDPHKLQYIKFLSLYLDYGDIIYDQAYTINWNLLSIMPAWP